MAHDLYIAILQADWSGLDKDVFHAIAYLTYGNSKTKAEVTPQDIRYLMGAGPKLRTDRIADSVARLLARQAIFQQELVNGSYLLGIQKDYDRWIPTDKMSATLQGISNINIYKYPKATDKMSVPDRLLAYVQERSGFTYAIPKWRLERKYAVELYSKALARLKDPNDAYQAITDYIDENEWMRENVKMQFTFMSQWFPRWLAQIPPKTRAIRDEEQTLGRRFKYNIKGKQWVATNERI